MKYFLLAIFSCVCLLGCSESAQEIKLPERELETVVTPKKEIKEIPVKPQESIEQYIQPKKEIEKVREDCDSNYSGCVPVASDVDCAGGKGNGPAYVRGPVRVIGSDVYDLDRDGDGVACE